MHLPVVSVLSGELATLKPTSFDDEVDFLPFPMIVLFNGPCFGILASLPIQTGNFSLI